MTLRRLAVTTTLAVLVAMPVLATDRPISGTKLVLARSTSGKEKLVFVSKDPSFLFPTIGGIDDPGTGSPGGALVELFSPAEPSASLAVPPGTGKPGWTSKAGSTNAHRFTNRGAPDAVSSVRSVLLKEGRLLKIVARETGLALAAAQGAVAIRITTGNLRNCTLFGPSTVRRDQANLFTAKNASSSAVADCSDATLGGLNSCGDGMIQGGEECDGSSLGECADYGASCRPAGFPSSCQCCLDGGPGVQTFGCCNPSSILLPAPGGSGSCIATRCDSPFPCTGDDVCQGDGTCCSQSGTTCLVAVITPPVGLNSCCPGLECRGPDPFGVGCCVSDGGTCAADADCCSQHCGGSGTCDACRGAGGSCTSPFECCSLSCTGGTCDACAALGASCLSSATCCSGLCDPSTFSCVTP
jgi:hypothetical protein